MIIDEYNIALRYFDQRLKYVEKSMEILYYGGKDEEGKYHEGYYNINKLGNSGIKIN